METPNPPGYLQAGHLPTLITAWLYFDLSFMVWVLLGPLAPYLREEFHLTATQQGLLVAVPLLGGSIFRPIFGALGDWIGGRAAGLVGLTLTIPPLLFGWRAAHTLEHLYIVGFFLGIAGASFAVALPLASAWYPSRHQGLVMGILGAGNSGSLLAILAAPRLAERFGWANTFGVMILPMVGVLLLFALVVEGSPRVRDGQSWRDYVACSQDLDTLGFSFLYGLTFGGFVGFTSFLTAFFYDQYGVSKVGAGDFATFALVAGSLLRPFGGWLSDLVGGYRLLLPLLLCVTACLAATSALPSLPVVVVLFFVAVACLGMANGAVFQVVPQRFMDANDGLGLVTGIVGAAGGLGGFLLPSMLGATKDATGSYGPGLLVLSVCYFVGALVLLQLGSLWTVRWHPRAVKQSGVFSYRREWLG